MGDITTPQNGVPQDDRLEQMRSVAAWTHASGSAAFLARIVLADGFEVQNRRPKTVGQRYRAALRAWRLCAFA
jgi:hypothetical protein